MYQIVDLGLIWQTTLLSQWKIISRNLFAQLNIIRLILPRTKHKNRGKCHLIEHSNGVINNTSTAVQPHIYHEIMKISTAYQHSEIVLHTLTQPQFLMLLFLLVHFRSFLLLQLVYTIHTEAMSQIFSMTILLWQLVWCAIKMSYRVHLL